MAREVIHSRGPSGKSFVRQPLQSYWLHYIAIIAILAAILFPVFAQAREKARSISCLSNLKQLGTGINMYVQDYDETFPYFCYGQASKCNPSSPAPSLWPISVYPYVKNLGVFACPSHTLGSRCFPPQAVRDFSPWKEIPNAYMSYAYNEYFSYQAVRLAQLGFPTETVFIADGMCAYAGGSWASEDRSWLRKIIFSLRSPDADGFNCCHGDMTSLNLGNYARHQGGNNIMFRDGHAKWFKAEATRSIRGNSGGTLRYHQDEWNGKPATLN